MIAHIVLFTPRKSLTQSETLAFSQLVQLTFASIPQIRRAVVGRRIDVDPGYARSFGDKAYEYAAVLEFDGKDELVAYLTHPLHHRLGRMFWETCDSTVVMEVACVDGKDAVSVEVLVK